MIGFSTIQLRFASQKPFFSFPLFTPFLHGGFPSQFPSRGDIALARGVEIGKGQVGRLEDRKVPCRNRRVGMVQLVLHEAAVEVPRVAVDEPPSGACASGVGGAGVDAIRHAGRLDAVDVVALAVARGEIDAAVSDEFFVARGRDCRVVGLRAGNLCVYWASRAGG